jgi:hypothetical protein
MCKYFENVSQSYTANTVKKSNWPVSSDSGTLIVYHSDFRPELYNESPRTPPVMPKGLSRHSIFKSKKIKENM